MSPQPSWMSPRRVSLVRRLRRERTWDEAHRLDPGQRFERACALLELARSVDPPPRSALPGSDEPPELWLALQRRFRARAGRG